MLINARRGQVLQMTMVLPTFPERKVGRAELIQKLDKNLQDSVETIVFQ
jgi:hypothetical protein